MTITPKRCPCGSCKKVILEPVCGCQCSSVQPEVAHEVATKVNRFDDVLAMLEAVALNRGEGLKSSARELVETVRAELKAGPPSYPEYPWLASRRSAI